jgi:hypothetical protein
VNDLEWDEFTSTIFLVGQPILVGSSLMYKFYKVPPICIATNGVRSYYVFGTANITRAYIHLSLHEHLVKAGENQAFKERTCTLIGEHVEKTPKATNSAIIMEVTRVQPWYNEPLRASNECFF